MNHRKAELVSSFEPRIGSDCPEFWRQRLASFSRFLRTPLSIRDGSFEAPSRALETFSQEMGESSRAGLELYHRQHWVRFLETLQGMCSRTSRALGYFEFNREVLKFLCLNPPGGHDLGELGLPLVAFLRHRMQSRQGDGREVFCRHPEGAIEECLAFDEAEIHALLAPDEPASRVSADSLAAWLHGRVVYARSFTLLTESYSVKFPDGMSRSEEGSIRFVRRSSPRYLVCRRDGGRVIMERVEDGFAALLAATRKASLEQVLSEWERTLDSVSLEQLRVRLPTWIREAVERAYWISVSDPA